MNPKAVYKYCKHLGCCEACCLRYIGIKNPNAYENVSSFVIKYQDDVDTKPISANEQNQTNATNNTKEITLDVSRNDNENINGNSLDLDIKGVNNSDSPACKKRKLDVCVSCLGILQEDNWTESYVLVKDVLFKKRYECKTFACALSAPIATLLRERAITLRLAEELPGYDDKTLTALKEAWKWSFGVRLAAEIDKILDSGAVSPLLITLNYDYADDLQELEILKQVSPQLFEERSKQKRRFVTEFTRRSVEQALENASVQSLRAAGGGLPGVAVRAMCIGAVCTHAPTYLAGRYIKLSRNLPQSPWILDGKRVLPSSVQEIIYKPLADFYNLESEEADRRLKLIAAGREDVDVRCLGDGRPFAIEITDPTRPLSSEELSKACEEISKSGEVIVKKIVPITKEDLVQLKKGEETKSKTYEALCIKLSHSKYDDIPPDSPIKVTPEDIDRINSFSNSPQNPKPSENIQKNSNHTLNTTKSSQDASGPTCKTPEDLKDKVDSVESTKSVLISESIDNDKNIPMDTSGDIVDTSNGVKKAEKIDNLEDIKDTEMKISINIREDESRDSKNTNADILDKSNGDQKSEKLENSEDNRNIVMETSGNTDVKDPSKDNLMDTFNGFQTTKTLDNTVHSKDPGDLLDTSKELTESVIQDSPEDAKITIQQKTPIRVLHRRPLLTRTRQILELNAIAVPEHPQLFRIRVRTSAGTYVKEWAHGELGRTSPALGDALGAAVDMLALDVTAVHLAWPPRQ